MRGLWPLFAALVCTTVDAGDGSDRPFKVPEGFEVSLFADADLARDITAMTLDSHGRVVVAGRRYIKTLHDDDGDGKADRATEFANITKTGARGMVFDGNDLYCANDDHVMRLRDIDGRPARLAEHGAKGLTIGPDGRLYGIRGNDADGSDNVQLVSWTLDGRQSRVTADGFHDPSDLAFDAQGRIWTVDAEAHRKHPSSTTRPDFRRGTTRLFDVGIGQHHGSFLHDWTPRWSRPAVFFDHVPRELEIGPGSPSGVTVYRHTTFPRRYRNVPFGACWTTGRVYAFPFVEEDIAGSAPGHRTTSDLSRGERQMQRTVETFLAATGDVDFAPVDIAVGRDGELIVATGGRGTRAGVFVVRYVGDGDEASRWTTNRKALEQPEPEIESVLRCPQPLDAWSRATWKPAARRLGPEAFVIAVCDTLREPAERVRAIEILREMFPEHLSGVRQRLLASKSTPSEVIARWAWALDRSIQFPGTEDEDQAVLAKLAKHPDPRVQRAVRETMGER